MFSLKHVLPLALACAFALMSSASKAQSPETTLKNLENQLRQSREGDLADFAPESYKRIKDTLLVMRGLLQRGSKISENIFRDIEENLRQFQETAEKSRKYLKRAQQMRQAALQNDFIREYSSRAFYQAEKKYQESLELAEKRQFDQLNVRAGQAANEYARAIQSAQEKLKRQVTGVLEKQKASIVSDLRTVNNMSGEVSQLGAANLVLKRVSLSSNGFQNPLDGSVVIPPPPDPPGPIPPVAVGILERNSASIQIAWHDRSDNEIGNRVLRTTDMFNWQPVAELGALELFSRQTYTDINLQHDTRYCYQIESYNDDGARQSQFRCTYTRDTNDIPIWRLQLYVKVADLENAGTDNTVQVFVGVNGGAGRTQTLLDYGRDDLETGGEYYYDLNLNNIPDLGSILDLAIGKQLKDGESDDMLLVEEIALVANNDKDIFRRNFGTTTQSVMRLGTAYNVSHDELRDNPAWESFIIGSRGRTFNLPEVGVAENDNGFQFLIPNKEIVSRIESLIGHLLHVDSSDLYGRFAWGKLDGPAVEVTQKDDETFHVDLDLENLLPIFPNPAMDIDFDVAISKSCETDNNGENKLVIRLRSRNFTSNASFELWRLYKSRGLLLLVDLLIDWYAKECATPPEFNRQFEISLPSNISCDDIQVGINSNGDLTICCFNLSSFGR